MVIYSLVIRRPSFHFDWGLSFNEKELRDTGAPMRTRIGGIRRKHMELQEAVS